MMTKTEQLLRKALELAEAERYREVANLLDKASDDAGAVGKLAAGLLSDLEGDPESLILSLNELLEGATV